MKRLFLFLLAVLGAAAGPAQSAGRQPFADNLAADAALATSAGVPIVILFSASSCHYCEDLRAGVIDGMARQDIFENRAIVRVIETDGLSNLVDFDGGLTSHQAFAARNKVSFTPIVRIFGPRADVLVDDIEGVPNLDFYSYYLDQAIDAARQRLNRSRHASNTAP
ncbi:MAG: hypothetical protein LJE84_07410 [Gammaproteobacteria bacterium]|jgi:thioredoxin-related protein|nr:hypothetical protein [Gammaproteobacteria bacterium]